MEKVSCCGMMCNECPVYIATEKDDETMRRYLAHEYSSEERKFYPKDIVCHGCHTVSADHNKFGKDCGIRKCCKEKHKLICAECIQFPCEKTEMFVPEGTEQRARLEEMHEACKNLL